MSVKPVIHIQPVEAWLYHIKNQERLEEELVEIASDESTNTSVYMTDEDGYPYLYVYRDDKKIFQSACRTQYEAERNLRVVYAQYLTMPKEEIVDTTYVDDDDDDVDVPPCTDLDAMSDEEWQKYCDEREDAIFAAVSDLVSVLTEDQIGAIEVGDPEDDDFDKIVNKIVEYLAVHCGFCIRRPMEVVDDDSGDVVRTEYPYEEFDFDDSDLIAK